MNKKENELLKILKKDKQVGCSLIELKSLFLKYFFMRHLIQEDSLKKNEKGQLLDYIHIDVEEKQILQMLEKIEVLKKKIPLDLFLDFDEILRNSDKSDVLAIIQNNTKIKGQYFTNIKLIKHVYSELGIESANKSSLVTVADISSGDGSFLLYAFELKNVVPYSVEFDPLIYEFQVFNLFFSLHDQKKKMILPLIVKNGDSLLGYNFLFIKELIKRESTLRNHFLTLEKIRKEIIFSKGKVSSIDVYKCHQIREMIAKKEPLLKHFNFIVDFPELFLDTSLEKKEKGFDYVVGNPPWLQYKNIEPNYKKYLKKSKDIDILYGKYNLALPFLFIIEKLAKEKIGIILPNGILTDTYGKKWREKIKNDKLQVKILSNLDCTFNDVSNEFFLLIKNVKGRCNFLEMVDIKQKEKKKVYIESLSPPLFLIPTFSLEFQKKLNTIMKVEPKLKDIAIIRRGLTLTKKYQNYYSKQSNYSTSNKIVNIVKHNIFSTDYKEGVCNYWVYTGKEKIVYDKKMLGAAGKEELFEKPKIVRRNRGRKLFIGLDLEGVYVNDIFDIILPKDKSILFGLFGYLSSSFVQFFSENYFVRDITSNHFREMPVPAPISNIWEKIDIITKDWLKSNKDLYHSSILRKKIDNEVYSYFKLSENCIKEIEIKTPMNWIDY